MHNPNSNWRKRIYQKLPHYVTVLGYVIGLTVLGVAASTWFVKTNISVAVTGSIKADQEEIHANSSTLIMKRYCKTGEIIGAGKPVMAIIDEPNQLQRLRYVTQLKNGLNGLMDDDSSEFKKSFADFKKFVDELAVDDEGRTVESQKKGWITYINPGGILEQSPIDEGEILFVNANLEKINLELKANDTRMPTIKPGDSVVVFMSDWEDNKRSAHLTDLKINGTFEVPRSLLNGSVVDKMAAEQNLILRINELYLPVKFKLEPETIYLESDLSALNSDHASKIKTERSYSIEFPQFNEHCKAKLSSIQSDLKLTIEGIHLSKEIRDDLEKNLNNGISCLDIKRAWIQIRKTRMFSRLFGK